MSNIDAIKKTILEIATEANAGKVIDIFERLDKLKDESLVNRISEVESGFNNSIAMLAVVQNNFTGQCDPLNDQIMFYSLEGIRSELKNCYRKLTSGTFYEVDAGKDYPMVI